MVARAFERVAATAVLLALSACGSDDEVPEVHVPETMSVTSTAFGEGNAIPAKYTCDGDNLSPPLSWEQVPPEAVAVALVMDDPDAPSGTFTHWVVLDIEPGVTTASEGEPPAGGVEAQNSAGQASYFGPCPPSGTHHYRFTVYALSARTGLAAGASLKDALAAVDEQAIAKGRLTGVYSRS